MKEVNLATLKTIETNKLLPKQLEIYDGLKNIGEEIAALYYDGVKIYNSNLVSKSYILAHLSREIEGGIRDVWGLYEEKLEKCDKCGRPNQDTTHIDSICAALNVDKEDPLVKKWHKTAKEFHKYAHRHGGWKSPREKDEFDKNWCDFEEILYSLTGNYIALLNRIDRLLEYDKPTKRVINTLQNLLKNKSRYHYFFKNLISKEWLIPLYKSDFFNPKNNPDPIEDPNQPGAYSYPPWVILDYLERCAKENQEKPITEITDALFEILDNIIKNQNDNYYTSWNVTRILFLLPIDRINLEHIDFIGGQLTSKGSLQLMAHELGDQIIPKLIKSNSKQLLLHLLKRIIDFKETHKGDKIEYTPILDEYYFEICVKKYKEDIAKICGIDSLKMGIEKLDQFIEIDETQTKNRKNYTKDDFLSFYKGEKYRNQIDTFIRDMLKELLPAKIEVIVKKFIESTPPIYKQLALHALNIHYNNLKQVFWSLHFNPLLNYELKPDTFELLKNNNSKFTDEEMEKFLNWLNEFEKERLKNFKDNLEVVAYRKKEWLTAFRANDHPLIKKQLAEVNQIVPQEIDHSNRNYWVEVGAGEPSRINVDELLSKNRQELIKFLQVNEDQSIASVLRQAIIEKPEQFDYNMNDFFAVPAIFINTIFRGFWEAWRKRKNFDWNNVLDFILAYIKDVSKNQIKKDQVVSNI